eukprot:GHUV01029433.1.p1 GENE.GHUV01029433.1~~GHUV01029433.1.p1  ORF type:complete len:343 (+),score=161.13 GHUV01029433.1:360-1388(+)
MAWLCCSCMHRMYNIPASRPAAPSGASPPQSRAADSLSSSQCVPAPSAASSSRQPAGSSNSAKPFDPLKRRGKAKPAAFSQAAGLGGSSLGSSSSSSTAAKASSSSSSHSSSRPALTPEVHKLQEDLAKLMSEWSTAMHPEADEPSQPAAGQQQRGVSAVLAALAEQTQRTVQEQSRIRPPPAGAAAGGGAADAAGGGEQMTVIVDVVMQHLLSKEVLYQPMKEILDKYPPWLDKHSAPGGSSTLTPDDLERYKHQYMCIRRLCEAYETEPDNTPKIMELLQEMQACGEPPAEIVEEMSAAIAGDLPADAAAGTGAGDMSFDNLDLEGLGELPAELKNCPVQ